MSRRLRSGVLALLLSGTSLLGQTVRMVEVADGVSLEVVDWGGMGRPIVLLAGYLTAHAYDAFAPELTKFGHVYGITRRGLGASSKPESGYDAKQSAKDILRVLDSLKLVAPVLVGHSFGGQDLSTIGATKSDRVAGLVYLNSAEDPTLQFSDYGVDPVDGKMLPASMRNRPAPNLRSIAAYQKWQLETEGVAFPESELRQLYLIQEDGSLGSYLPSKKVRNAMFQGRQKPEYSRIQVPVLAFFSALRPLEEQRKKFPPMNAGEGTALEQQFKVDLAIQNRHIRDLRVGVPTAKIVVVPRANFYIFLSSGAELISEMGSCLKTLD